MAVLLCGTSAYAHREDFIGETLVFLTLQRSSIEPEAFVDFGGRSRMYSAALEAGITDHLMIDGRASWMGQRDFDSARVESRYRFGEEGARPIDIAASLEANVEKEDGKRRFGVEPRLILSKDVAKLNVTLNLAEEIRSGRRNSALRIASGVRYDATDLVRFGTEFQYDVRTREGSFIPQLWFSLPHDTTLKAGYFGAFHGAPHFVRAAVEFEF